MKLLLTSAGLKNKKISNALIKLVGKPAKETSVAFIPTAANYERGDKSWMIQDIQNIQKQGFKSLDIIDISALPKEEWLNGFKKADVLFFEGGNTFYLMHWIEVSDLKSIIPELLKKKVYVGSSAGSCVAGPKVLTNLQKLFPDEENKYNVINGLGLVQFHIVPHLNSQFFKELKENKIRKLGKNIKEPIYVIDDQCAIEVTNDSIKVIGEGKHFEINETL